jgi:DNA repair protein RadA/Sms
VNARILRTLKNRFGPVEEVGIFDMTEKGLVEIANPSEVFLQDRVPDVAGSIVTVVLEGTRPLLVEVQALVVSSQLAMPRRVANGVDSNRLQLIIAILQKRLGLPLGSYDIFVNISGGYKITEPSADLAIALSIISSLKNCPLISNSVAYGELGLLGEIRMVTQKDRRDKEARRVGFTPLIQTVKRSNIASIVEKAFKDKNQV